jgi:hypothetical protein
MVHTKCVLGKWLTFLVLARIAAGSLVFGAPSDEFEKRVSVGIKAGVPLTDLFKFDIGSYQVETKRYAIGPIVDIRVWRKVGIETGAMYKRVDQQGQFSYVIVPCSDEECTNGVVGHYGVSAAGRSWEFPVAGQYHFSLHGMRPYAEGGFSYNHLTNIFTSPVPISFVPDPTGPPPPRQSINRTGLLLGGGAEIMLRGIHVTPGLRYTRYRGHALRFQNGFLPSGVGPVIEPVGYFLPSSNSADFLVGFTF